MPRMRIALLSLAATAVLAPAAATAAVGGACTKASEEGTVQQWSCTTAPIAVSGFEVLQSDVGPASFGAPKPDVDGFITAMRVDVTDADGTPIPISRLMLHHIVFANLGAALGDKHDGTCSTFTLLDSKTMLPALGERFYGAGEERATLGFPPGYGYRTKAADQWALTYMFMNHRGVRDTAYIHYDVTVDTAPDVVGADPYWLDVRNCRADPVFTVPGGGAKGSTFRTASDWTVPHGSRLITAGGHVHGGAKQLVLSQPSCGDRTLLTSRPAWGLADDAFYTVRPILHEPGPISMSAWGTQAGIPLAAGETLRLSAAYDGALPHPRVMGIMMAYLVPDAGVSEPVCGALPADLTEVVTNAPHRDAAPRFAVPLTGVAADGRAVAIRRPAGATRVVSSGTTIAVSGARFAWPNVRVHRGATLRWRFDDPILHDVTLANGPRGFHSPHLDGGRVYARRFTRPGVYRYMCVLHPVAMTGTVTVGT